MEAIKCKTEAMCVNKMETGGMTKLQGVEVLKMDKRGRRERRQCGVDGDKCQICGIQTTARVKEKVFQIALRPSIMFGCGSDKKTGGKDEDVKIFIV